MAHVHPTMNDHIIPIINRVDCKFDERFINITCSFTEPNTGTNQTVSLEAEILREIRDIRLTAAYYVVTGDSINRILKRTVDLCAYVKRPNIDRLIKVFYDHMLPNNRFVTGCPISEKEHIYVRNVQPSAIRVPGFLPESNFIFETSYQMGVLSETFINVRYYGRLVRFVNDQPLVSHTNRLGAGHKGMNKSRRERPKLSTTR
uniref:Uncharacterized protein n=1 Tax=Anopheles minimus TaxID=112268 RepID=A0A182W209_9DIPT